VPGRVERVADAADASVHHVRGRDDVDPGLGLRQRLAHQGVERRIVDDLLAHHDPVMAVRGVRVERDVADHADAGDGGFDRADRPVHEVFGVPGLLPARALALGRGEREQRDGRYAELGRSAHCVGQSVDAEPLHPGHRGHRLGHVVPLAHEDRPDQVFDRQAALRDQRAPPWLGPVAAHAHFRKGAERAPFEGREGRGDGLGLAFAHRTISSALS
jgi:hypothetical protein